ncbi:MAG TPA: N-acetyltransferase [Myxococcales bacterium]|nr:GNAT family N-acetyltransferase [Deltaproteobacteria bacterium]MBU54792.1 GNAT family N-acetyltransferase [Deltaproteobacteria bacterium]HAA55394.1 N-acetyltransferase [Myxococcales bacterium]|tara:strand:- start:7558 stop:8106 length:549 start_codon:yes stop_codon:yes gene_type:complete
MFSPIECGPINIRSFREEDLSAFATYRAIPEVARYQSWTTYTYEDALSLYHNMQTHPFGTPGEWFQLAIVDASTDQLIGDLAVHFIDEQQVEVGFTMSPTAQGKGYATRALSHFVERLFTNMKKHRIIATVDALNTPAYTLLERVGFRREAHFIENIFFKGAWGSEYQYALLSSEWKEKHVG